MGWSVGESDKWPNRHIGYGVPAYCDYPGCAEEIDRGLSYVCGMVNTDGEDRGCGLHFCSKHMGYSPKFKQLCVNCYPRLKKPLTPKPDHPEWLRHILTDETWENWRKECPEWLEQAKQQLNEAGDTGGVSKEGDGNA